MNSGVNQVGTESIDDKVSGREGKMKKILCLTLAFVLAWAAHADFRTGVSPAKRGAAEKSGGAGSWIKMSKDAPIVPRALIGAVPSGDRLVVWGGEIKDSPVSDGAFYDLRTDTWKAMAKAPIEGREHFTMLADGDKIIIWGGENTPAGAIYDIATDSWKKMADAPVTLGMEPYTSGLAGRKMLVWGIGRTSTLNAVGAVYDIDRDSWRKMADAPIKAIDGWPPLFYKNKFIVWGAPGDESSGRFGAVYDIDADSWKEMAKAPITRRNWSASVLFGNKLLVWGGCPGPVEAHTAGSQNDGAIYDIDKDTWKKMADSPLSPRFFPKGFLWRNKVVIWGGLKDKFFYDGAVYDPEKDVWEKIAEAPLQGQNPRELYSYGIFGYNPTPPNLAGDKLVVWSMHCRAVYDLSKKKWEEMAAGPISGRDYHVSFLYGDTLLIWGGRDEKGARADGALYKIRQESEFHHGLASPGICRKAEIPGCSVDQIRSRGIPHGRGNQCDS
jgi:N-acetylneuraminic acid mutarotase